ncbi:GAF and ANTAR domain-containing protein [Clavibacter sp. Sh2141]|uniref:GAF and ANTAR domain-containing protein n=1 Tax=Clavibacter sp. Sh2141 TaxID=3395374 RepID=UPI0039BC4690
MDDSAPPTAHLDGLEDVVGIVRSGVGVLDAMDVLVRACVDRAGAVEAAIVITDADGGLHAVASSNERTLDVEETQIGTQEGICVECVRTGALVEVPDIEQVRERWPAFAASAADAGFRSGVAVPLRIGDRTVGGLNLFYASEGRQSLAALALVQALVQVAGLRLVPRPGEDERTALDLLLEQAVEGRTVIEQAKGFLAYDRDTSVQDAFALMRDHARANRLGVVEVAGRVLGRELVV